MEKICTECTPEAHNTAKEMREYTKASAKVYLIKKIREEASKGNYRLVIDEVDMPDEGVKILKELGYEVTRINPTQFIDKDLFNIIEPPLSPRSPYYIISWMEWHGNI